jgi:hypothetical protein
MVSIGYGVFTFKGNRENWAVNRLEARRSSAFEVAGLREGNLNKPPILSIISIACGVLSL